MFLCGNLCGFRISKGELIDKAKRLAMKLGGSGEGRSMMLSLVGGSTDRMTVPLVQPPEIDY